MNAPVSVPQHAACPDCDATAVDHLDEAWATACEVVWTHFAEAPTAEWIVWYVCGCPPGRLQFCTPCRDVMLADRTSVECRHCLGVWSPVATAVRLIEPLNRRTA